MDSAPTSTIHADKDENETVTPVAVTRDEDFESCLEHALGLMIKEVSTTYLCLSTKSFIDLLSLKWSR